MPSIELLHPLKFKGWNWGVVLYEGVGLEVAAVGVNSRIAMLVELPCLIAYLEVALNTPLVPPLQSFLLHPHADHFCVRTSESEGGMREGGRAASTCWGVVVAPWIVLHANARANESAPSKSDPPALSPRTGIRSTTHTRAHTHTHTRTHTHNHSTPARPQTGTGKSHTMEGREDPPSERGIIPNTFDYIFSRIKSESG